MRDEPKRSYVELEFEAATDRGLPRLLVLLDEEAELPLPANRIIDHKHGRRQAAFRRRLQPAGVISATIATPADLETRLYQALVELTARPAPPLRSDSAGTSVAVPVGRLPIEVRGRENLLRQLQTQCGLVVLAGMGGIGKSTVAAELARITQVERLVWWVSAADASSLTGGVISVARQLGANESDLEALVAQAGDGPDRLWALLERAPAGWLLVFDNADQPDLLGPSSASIPDGTSWIRASARGLVVVTSRQVEQETWGRQARLYVLASLPDREAGRVLLDLAPGAGDQAQAEALAHRLGGLPLALHLAGSSLGSGITRWSSF